eukprot:Lithocolla_globosa_v1_NODE_972_length_3006_cov_3.496103.p2 type:complete len:208 gc:universal NODE_972_length_3006_cov_3.496103:875-1498(+)
MDEIHKKQKVPSAFLTPPKSITDLAYWKAADYVYWCLFSCVFVLRDRLKQKFYQHWLFLVGALHLLMSRKISKKKHIDFAEKNINFFVDGVCTLYGLRFMTSNVHELLHFVKCVRFTGSLVGYSCFTFEYENGALTKFITGNNQSFVSVAYSSILLHTAIFLGIKMNEPLTGHYHKLGSRRWTSQRKIDLKDYSLKIQVFFFLVVRK